MGARTVQFIAAAVCVAALTVAGFIQPKLISMASEQYLSVRVAREGSQEGSQEGVLRRVPISQLRAIETAKAIAAVVSSGAFSNGSLTFAHAPNPETQSARAACM